MVRINSTRPASPRPKPLGVAYANALGCGVDTVACLGSRSTPELLANADSSFNQSTVDGWIMPESQISALAAGHIQRVMVMQSVNSHEGRFFVPAGLPAEQYQAVAGLIAAATGKPPELVLATYPLPAYPNAFEGASAMYGDASFACTASIASQFLAHWVPTFMSEFNDAGASQFGAMHTAELKYLFNLNFGGPVVVPASLPASSQTLRRDARILDTICEHGRSEYVWFTGVDYPDVWEDAAAGHATAKLRIIR